MSLLPVKPGDVIRTRRHVCAILVRGRNGSHPEMLWGEALRNGKPDPETCKCFMQREVIALATEDGMRMLLCEE